MHTHGLDESWEQRTCSGLSMTNWSTILILDST